jgi:sugar phosphate permease
MGTMGSAMAAFVYPLFTQLCIDELGWRTTWIVLGVTAFFMIVPFAFIIRRQPEDVGLLPDGDTPEQAAEYQRQRRARGEAAEEQSFTVKEALHMPALWLVVATMMVVAPGMGGINATWVPHFQDIGISPGLAATSLTVYGAFSVLARFFWGFFVERHHVRKVLIVILLMYSIAMFFLLNVETGTVAIMYSAYQGLITGGWVGINPLVYPTYFGRRYVGSIQGTVAPLTTAASAAGPFLIATVFDMTGSYRGAYTVMMFGWLVAAALMYFARPPRRGEPDRAPEEQKAAPTPTPAATPSPQTAT